MNATQNMLLLLFLVFGVAVYALSAILFFLVQHHLRKDGSSRRLALGCCVVGMLCAVFGLLLFILYLWPSLDFLLLVTPTF